MSLISASTRKFPSISVWTKLEFFFTNIYAPKIGSLFSSVTVPEYKFCAIELKLNVKKRKKISFNLPFIRLVCQFKFTKLLEVYLIMVVIIFFTFT